MDFSLGILPWYWWIIGDCSLKSKKKALLIHAKFWLIAGSESCFLLEVWKQRSLSITLLDICINAVASLSCFRHWVDAVVFSVQMLYILDLFWAVLSFYRATSICFGFLSLQKVVRTWEFLLERTVFISRKIFSILLEEGLLTTYKCSKWDFSKE